MTGPSQPTLDELRRARGEGWQWPRTATDACPQCRFHAAGLPRDELGPKLLESAAAWHEFLLAAGDAYLRTNPEPGVFSPLQYGAHVRDILRVYGDRVLLAVAEDNPTFPQFNPEENVWEAYNQLGAAELAGDLDAQARRLANILEGLTPEGWSRTLTRDGGEDGVFTFTVSGQACYAVHEAHHHLLDANGTLPDGAHGAPEDRRAEWDAMRARHLKPPEERPPSSARGVHHLALLSSDVEATINFYQDLLEFPLTELFENRDYRGSTHFFFDIGHGNLLAFFDFPGLGLGHYAETLGGVHHVAISVAPDRWESLRDKLDAAGVTTECISGSSLYFSGPDGERLELIKDPLGEMYGSTVA